MKTTVKLTGNGIIIYLDREDQNCCFYQIPFIIENIKLEILNEDGTTTDITKGKGKYIKEKYLRKLVKDELGDNILLGTRSYNDIERTFEIEHNGEFNPKSLQLIKSDYEFSNLPYGIVCEFLLYDDSKILCVEECDYKPPIGLEEVNWNEGNQMYL